MSLHFDYPSDYFAARERFRAGAARIGGQLETVPITPRGPQGQELTIDVAILRTGQPQAVLVLSSGLHGVEGPFGSAVQSAVMEEWASAGLPKVVAVVLIHSLNPYGFAWVRRTNEDNIDLNRNFLLPGEKYEGSPPLYAELDHLLNPPRPPSVWEPFQLKAYLAIARYGLPALMQAIAGGQYDFPRGLFFGGQEPSETMRILQSNLGRWVGGAARVLHLDFHTGLGKKATYKLLVDYSLSEEQSSWLRNCFGAGAVESNADPKTAYQTRGSLGQWCKGTFPDKDYVYLCAEFGTYPALRVIEGLRAENQAHFWDRPASPGTRRAKQRLLELLNPAPEAWREEVIRKGVEVVRRGVAALVEDQ